MVGVDVQLEPLVDIDHLGVAHLLDPLDVMTVVHMDMAVEEIFGLIFVDQIHKGLKAPVANVVVIAHSNGGGMGDHNIHTLMPPELKTQLSDSLAHFLIGVLVVTGAVPPAAAKT